MRDGDRDRQRCQNRNKRGEAEGNPQETLFHGPCLLALPGAKPQEKLPWSRTQGSLLGP